ncbi:MAG TPA: hypothetical protein VFA15_03790 [Nitrososphaera sp.]|nr:hypothetical protein [Nitrososphaera sp.]
MNLIAQKKHKLNLLHHLWWPTGAAMISLLALASGSSAEPQSEQQETGVMLLQTCGVLGDQEIFITSDKVRVSDLATGLTTISAAPDWKVLTFDNKTKTYAESALNNYRGYIQDQEFVDPGIRWPKLPLTADKPAAIAGENASCYTTPPSFSEKQTKDWQQESASPTFAKDARYCVSTHLSTDKHVSAFLARFYQLPEKDGLPLQFKYHTIKGDLNTWLFTTAIKKGSAPAIRAAVPVGFTRLPSALDVRGALRNSQAAEKTKRKRPLL